MIPMPRFVALAAVSIAALLGCSSPTETDLALNGFIQSGWHSSVEDGPIAAYPAEVFALANPKLDDFIDKLTGDSMSECFLVPQTFGYDVVILTRKLLSKADEASVSTFVETALSQAQKEAAPFFEERSKLTHP